MDNFLIIGHPRCGSTLLCRSLDQHPDLSVYVEALHPFDGPVLEWRKKYTQEIYGLEYLEAIRDGRSSRLKERSDFHLLTERIFADYNGFKILIQQLPISYKIWEHFQADKNLKIVFLTRNNLLESALSNKLAQKTRIWQVDVNEQAIEDEPIFLESSFLIKYFKEITSSFKHLKNLFSQHDSFDLQYELLCNNWDSKIYSLEEFLGIKKYSLPMMTGKRTGKDMHQLISNYSELEKEFENTEWDCYFNKPILFL